MPGQTKPGEVTACSIQFRRDGFSAKGRDSEPPRLRIAPCFPVLASWPRILKNCYGMLNVLPPVVSVKGIHLHIVARKCHTYPIWKNPAASSGCLPEQPRSSRSKRELTGVRERFAERVRPATRLARGPERAMCRWGMLAKAHRCSRTERADECSETLPRTRQHNRRGGRNVRGRGRR
jgi:hypothetical protein